MTVRLVSPHLVHGWLPAGFFVVQAAPTSEEAIASAVTCARSSENTMWLASSSAFLRRVKLPNKPFADPVELDESFLSSLFELDDFPHSDKALSVDVGTLRSISCVSTRKWTGKTDDLCDCVMEVFGENGYALVGTHDGFVRESFDWQHASASVAMCLSLPSGGLRQAVIPSGFTSSALVSVGAAGLIRAVPGSSFSGIRSTRKWNDGPSDIANIHQLPVFHICDLNYNIMVIVGCLRAGIVLYRDKRGRLGVSRFLLKGSTKRLNRYSIVVAEEGPNSLVLEELASGHRIGIEYAEDSRSVILDLDCDKRLRVSKSQKQKETHSVALRGLLRGIEDLGERERCFESDSRRTEALISSYNSALLFVSEWKAKSATSSEMFKNSCSVKVDVANAQSASNFNLPVPSFGKQIFISVAVKNSTGIGMADGWMLRLELRKDKLLLKKRVSSQQAEDRTTVLETSNEMVRTMTCPIQSIAPREAKSYSFPVVIDSHAPLLISVGLSFHHPTSSFQRETPVDIQVCLMEESVLDILDFSYSTEKKDIQDSSHELLIHSQLMRLFNNDLVEDQRGYPLVTRVEIPLAHGELINVLGMHAPSTTFQSYLGAEYMVSVAPASLQGGARPKENFAISTIAIRGVPHVIPFVRAALLRRVLRAVEKNPSILKPITVRGRTNIQRWQQSLAEAAENCLPPFRKAEARLVEALRMYQEIEHGAIEYFQNEQDREAILAALRAAKGSYALWRRQTEHIWTPKGASTAPKD